MGKSCRSKKKTNKIVLNVNVCVVTKKHLVNVLNMIVNKFQSLHLDTKCRIIRMNFISNDQMVFVIDIGKLNFQII